MRSTGTRLSLCVLLAVLVLALFAFATPASASKLTTWLLGGASAYSFHRDNDTAGVLFGLGALYSWQQDRNASQRAQQYYVYPQPYAYAYPAAPVYRYQDQRPLTCGYYSRYCY